VSGIEQSATAKGRISIKTGLPLPPDPQAPLLGARRPWRGAPFFWAFFAIAAESADIEAGRYAKAWDRNIGGDIGNAALALRMASMRDTVEHCPD
jgi:hypothetical protein